jgi:stage V sporulation protein B
MLLKDESLSRKFITKWAWMYFFVFLAAPLGYITNIILTWVLTKVEFGIMYGVISFLSLVGIFSDMGLTESLNYFLPKHILKWDYARSKYLLWFVFVNQMIMSAVVSGVLYISAPWLATHFFHEPIALWVIQVMSLFFFGLHTLQVITSFFGSIQNVKIQKMIELFRSLFVVIGMAMLALSDRSDLLAYCWVWVMAIYATCVIAGIIFYIGYYRQYFSIKTERDTVLRNTFIQYSIGTLLSANVAILLHLVDQLFLTYFIGAEATWEYKVYLSLIGIPFIFLWPLIGFLYPVISEIGSRGDHEKIKSIFRIFSSYLSVLMLWVAGFFVMTGPHLAGLLFGESYLSSGVALYYIAPFLVLNALIQVNFQILGGLGHVRKRIMILAWTLLVNVILSMITILGYKYGYINFPSGSAAASAAVWASWICMWYLSYRAIGEHAHGFDWRFLWNNTVVVVILTWVYFFFTQGKNLTLGLTGKMSYIPSVWLAIFVCLTILLIVNFSHLRTFYDTIKKVRSGHL